MCAHRLFKCDGRAPRYDHFLRYAPSWRRKERPGEEVAMMLKDIETLRDRFNDAAIEQSIVWINRIDKKQWADAPAHWGEAGRLERPAAGALVMRCAGGEGKGESKDAEAPAPCLAQRSQVSVAGRIHYKCLGSKLELALGDMCIITRDGPARGERRGRGQPTALLREQDPSQHSTGSLLIHWSRLRFTSSSRLSLTAAASPPRFYPLHG